MNHRPLSSVASIRACAAVLGETPRDYDALLASAGNRPFVLLGEATHGTHEFYAMRAEITRRLIAECGFDAVVVEGDWPDVLRLNAHVTGRDGQSLDDAFSGFQRFPAWMWRNQDVRTFVEWLAAYNGSRQAVAKVGVFGMDLYSLYTSADAVIDYLERVDPQQAELARVLYAQLDHVRDPQQYGAEAASGLRPGCRAAAAALLADLVRKAPLYAPLDGRDRHFFAERNAYVVLHAEHYYRSMFSGRQLTWNLRDGHMVDTLIALRRHLREQGREGRIVVWAHNSHLGDARATEMGRHGEWNVGQLLRQAMGAEHVFAVGFTTYTGHVTAARDWDGPAERRWVRPASTGSYERLFHETRLDRFFLPLGDSRPTPPQAPLLERAIGVIYRPESERASHYFEADLEAQFDAVFHLDETTAVEPLDITEHWATHELPDTYPFGV